MTDSTENARLGRNFGYWCKLAVLCTLGFWCIMATQFVTPPRTMSTGAHENAMVTGTVSGTALIWIVCMGVPWLYRSIDRK